jgi:hypothetical protein
VSTASTPSFDPETYIQQVLGAFLRAPGDDLAPLLERYALDYRFADASDEGIRRWIHQVVDLWKRQAQMRTTLGQMCQRLLEADVDLRRSGSYDNPQWWRAQIRAAQPDPIGPADGFAPAVEGRPAAAHPAANGQHTAESAEPVELGPPSELPQPAGLEAAPSDDCVTLRWSLPLEAPAGMVLTVERSAGSKVHRLRPDSSRASAEDREPPAGRQLTYQVVAEHAEYSGRATSRPVTIVFAPPVTRLDAQQMRDGGVTGQWSGHADLWRVRVWRTAEGMSADQSEGVPVQARYDGFDDPHPPAGNHTYNVLPLYRDPSNGDIQEGKQAAVKVAVFATPPPPKVTWHEPAEASDASISFRWTELPSGMTLLLRRAVVEPPGAPGDLVMLDEAEGIGQFVARRLGDTTTSVSLPAGRWIIVPFAVAGDRAVRGGAVSLDVIPRITPLEVTRTGPDVLVSWAWPAGLRLAQVIWTANGVDVPLEVTYNEAQRRGGVLFRRGEAAKVQVTGIVRSGENLLMSAPTTADVPAQPPTMTFHVHGVRRFFGLLPWHDRRRVELVTDLPCTCTRAEIYVHVPGRDPGPDMILHATRSIEIGPDHPYEVTVNLPRMSDMFKPYYISCRAWLADDAIRVDQFASSGREIR